MFIATLKSLSSLVTGVGVLHSLTVRTRFDIKFNVKFNVKFDVNVDVNFNVNFDVNLNVKLYAIFKHCQ